MCGLSSVLGMRLLLWAPWWVLNYAVNLVLSLQLVLIITPKNSYASCMQGQTESVGSQWIGIWTDIFICSNKSSRYRWVPIIIISQRKSPTNISKWTVQIEFMFYVTYVIIIIIIIKDLHVSVKTFARVYSVFLVSNLHNVQ